MAPATTWDEEEEESTPPSSPPAPAPITRRPGHKFDDEEDDSDVLESWDAAEDSEVEREKTKKAEEAKEKALEEEKANKKSKSERIELRRQEKLRQRLENGDSEDSSDEDEAVKRQRLRAQEKEGDLKHASDLFGDIGVNPNRASKPVTVAAANDPTQTIDLSSLKLFSPNTLNQFTQLRETLVPLLTTNSKKAQYPGFMQELAKQLCKDMQSDQIKKVASTLTTLSNEKMREEKAAEKGGKKTKAAKVKTTLNAGRDTVLKADTNVYDDGLDDGDFM